MVEHEIAELTYRDGVYHSRIRRRLRNMGDQPVTQYLVRISVDRYPGDPERSNRLYRESPLTWEEIGLSAQCGDEPMTWRVKQDRDAVKEVWLLFENQDGRFPLYPGETSWISYEYSVTFRKWGPWWARSIRLPDALAEHDSHLSRSSSAGGVGSHYLDGCRRVTLPEPRSRAS